MDTYHAELPIAILDRLSMPITECGCYAWLGKHGTGGYPYISYRIWRSRVTRKAATVAWELENGEEVPEGLEISHLCLQEWCVNPEHVTPETHSENLKRRRPYRFVLSCPHCGGLKEQTKNGSRRLQWTCIPCRDRRSREWRVKRKTSL
jgi:hypothetical protein